MPWVIRDTLVGVQPITTIDTTQNHPLGTIVCADYSIASTTDPVLGSGEFIYLQGVANTVAGSAVTYSALTGATALCPNTANLAQPVAFAMAANVASSYGWYQISGKVAAKKLAVKVLPDVAIFISGTAGRIRGTIATGKQILGARTALTTTTTTTSSTVLISINRPHAQGQII